MFGALVLAAIIIVIIPVSVAMSGAVLSGILGWALKDNAEATHEGSELIELNT